MVFPELSVTGYTCSDLFHQRSLLRGAESALDRILAETAGIDMLAAVGMPVEADNQLFNCAVVIHDGRILGVVPKTFIPNYNEYYEKRWFASSVTRQSGTVGLCGAAAPFGEDLIFKNTASQLAVGVEICEDLWIPIPPSARHALRGANLLLNLSASNETVTKADYRRAMVRQQSSRCFAGYVYCSAGQGESTTDVVISGHTIIAAGDGILCESAYAEGSAYFIADIDIEKLMNDRRRFNTFMGKAEGGDYRVIPFEMRSGGDVRRALPWIPIPSSPKTGSRSWTGAATSSGCSRRDLPNACANRGSKRPSSACPGAGLNAGASGDGGGVKGPETAAEEHRGDHHAGSGHDGPYLSERADADARAGRDKKRDLH
jgi:NAD+ synthase (glutamine-hydrolysing)